MKKLLIISLGIVFLIILVSGIYFFIRGDKGDNLIIKINKLQVDLVVAKDKLNKEKKRLEALTSDLNNSFPLAIEVQNQMKKASEIVKQTDFMFTNPDGLNPELIVKNFLNSLSINNERKDINLLLLEWQKKMDILSINTIGVEESEQIKQEAQTIKTFIEDLSKIVGSFTLANSGFSQFQIDTYLIQLPSIEDINEVLSSLGNAIENVNNNSKTSNVENNTGTQDNQTSPNFPPITPSVIVTPDDVLREQVVVAEVQREMEILQEQLAQAEEQLPQPSPTPVVYTPAPAPVEINPTTNPAYINPYNINRDDYQGIIVQPGPPRLIQGTNQY